ncbi:MAG TPA: FCD domain-containing protein [Devosiaceae bacterium]|jgi:DNA-binding FadR family transcriptional regulator
MTSKTAVDQHLEKLLASGRYGPGAKLPTERDLALELGEGRSAIRNSLARLEMQGRVVRMLGSGTYVSPDRKAEAKKEVALVSDASPLEIMEARLLIEPRLAGLVAVNANAADFERIESCMRQAEAATSFEEFEHGDGAFHQAIADATHNGLMIAVYATISAARDHADWGELKRRSASSARRAAYETDHREIAKALKKRDQTAAEAALLSHLQRVRQNLLFL